MSDQTNKTNESKQNPTSDDRYERGAALIAEIFGAVGEDAVEAVGDLGRFIIEFGYGDIWSRDGLSRRERQIATISILTAMGREAELRPHIIGALRSGMTKAEIAEVLIHSVLYAGFPGAMSAMNLLNELAAEYEKSD